MDIYSSPERLRLQPVSTRLHVPREGSLTDRDEVSINKGTLKVEIPGNGIDR